MNICKKCGEQLDKRERFCTGCGEPVDPVEITSKTAVKNIVCNECGQELPSSATKCTLCLAPVANTQAVASPKPQYTAPPAPALQPQHVAPPPPQAISAVPQQQYTAQPIQPSPPQHITPPPPHPVVSQPQPQQSKQVGKGTIFFEVPDEDNATVTIAGKQLNVGLLVKIMSLAICACFFLPYMNIYGMLSASGSYSLFNESRYQAFGYIFLIVPALIFVAFQFKSNLKFLQGKLFLIMIIISAIGVFIYGNNALTTVREVYEYNDWYNGVARVSFTIWFWITLLSYAAIGFISIMCKSILKKNKRNAV